MKKTIARDLLFFHFAQAKGVVPNSSAGMDLLAEVEMIVEGIVELTKESIKEDEKIKNLRDEGCICDMERFPYNTSTGHRGKCPLEKEFTEGWR